jgi:hypothetical protein
MKTTKLGLVLVICAAMIGCSDSQANDSGTSGCLTPASASFVRPFDVDP